MEIKRRMSIRFAWLLGVTALVLIAVLMACSSSFNSSTDGLLVVSSQGSALLESFSFSLASGRITTITNSPQDTANETCVLPGFPSSIVLDPAGQYAYVILTGNSECPVNGVAGPTGIQAFQVNSDGTLTATGSLVTLNSASVGVCASGNSGAPVMETLPVVPVFLAMDASGYLYVADSATVDSSGNPAPGAVSVLAVSSGTLTEVPSSPFTVPVSCNVPANNLTALAATHTIYPPLVNGVQNAVCSDSTPPTAEYLYVADSTQAGLVWEFAVNTSTGALGNPPNQTAIPSFASGQVPSGVAVDPCNRFVYVSNQGTSNTISGFTICFGSDSTQAPNPTCPPASVLPQGDGSLRPVTGSPFNNIGSGNFPGPLIVDAYGNFLYVLNVSNNISPFRISPVYGSLTPLTPSPVAAGLGATSIAIRSDDSWLFVTNFSAATISQYAVTPASGALTPVPSIQTDNYPWGVAVK
jgi:DNA-binding beta-propeller fold protein YncE